MMAVTVAFIVSRCLTEALIHRPPGVRQSRESPRAVWTPVLAEKSVRA